ncbi:MAG: tRNA 4-thiouridine(8) synthase ThiI [Clostridia bacterium]|nr:tRNA 4-thiouridine(8) synthase ThiI [Clostridia bacterium]
MKEIILIKNGELALKGLNRSTFEQALIKNLRRRLGEVGVFKYTAAQSTINVVPQSDDIDLDRAVEEVKKVFGVARFSRAAQAPKDIGAILDIAPVYLEKTLGSCATFKVESKRSDKSFPMTSPEISAAVGGRLLASFRNLKVNVRNPDVVVYVEIRDDYAYIHAGSVAGAGGLPVGTSGRACLLLSGGIDSPVAGYMTAKRGVSLCAVHFMSPPYTSVRAEKKVERLTEVLTAYAGDIHLYKVDFARTQELIRDLCPPELFTVISRRMMMRTATLIAEKENALALITGESIAQVASQTLSALACTEDAAGMPVLRPCIGLDKNEIVETSRKIGAFDISIEPYEDCCAIFTPKHPKTNPALADVRKAEEPLDVVSLAREAAEAAVMKKNSYIRKVELF